MVHQNSKFSQYRILQVLVIIIMLSSTLAGCRWPWQPAEDVADVATESFTTLETIETVSEPRKDLPPALVEVTPVPESYISLQQPISLYFNQPMNTTSVEAAIRFEPSINGRFDWSDDQVLTFVPDQQLMPGTHLRMFVNTSAQAGNDKNLQTPIEISFQASEHLRVLQTVPSNGGEDIDPESVIFITFNQPVVPLGEEEQADPAFTIKPAVAGEGMWLNTSTYQFIPDLSMNGGTEYTIILNENLTANSGAGLSPSQERQFTFTTTTPQVLSIHPLRNEKLSLDGPVEIVFNIRMDPESVSENFTLTNPNGEEISGNFEWDPDYQTMTFIPETTLARNTTYTIGLGSGTKSYGGLAFETSIETKRTTFPVFAVEALSLPEFNQYYGEYGQYKIMMTTPVNQENFKNHIAIQPDVGQLSIFLSDENNIFVGGYFQPETQYMVLLNGELEDVWGGQLGEDLSFTFTSPAAVSSLTVVTGMTSNNMIFMPATTSEIALQATNINTINMEIAPIGVNDLTTLLHPDNFNYRQVFLPENLEISSHNFELTRNANEIVRIPLAYQDEELKPGFYYLGISSPDISAEVVERYQKFYLVISENNLVMKISPEQAFVWATRLEDYGPLTDAPVTVFTTEGDIVASGTTDAEGIFESSMIGIDEPFSTFFTIVGQPGQKNFGFNISSWNHQYALYEMGIDLNPQTLPVESYVYTDRPVYRPGDKVNFKAAVFSRENGLPVSANIDAVNVTVFGDAGMSGIVTTIYSDTLSLSSFGTVQGAFELPTSAQTGMYRIEITKDGKIIESFVFTVAAYRKPGIEVGVSLTPSSTLAGEKMSAEIQADTYFGLPVSEQSVYWTLFRKEKTFHLPGYRVGPENTGWLIPGFLGDSLFGPAVENGEGKTNPEGHLSFEFATGPVSQNGLIPGSLYEYTLEATVYDERGFPVSYRDFVQVHPETVYIGVQPESYFGNADSPFSFSILTAGWEKQAVGNVALEAVFEAITWDLEETSDPGMPFRYVPETTLIASASPITGEDGRSRLSFTPPEPGTYQLTVESGNAVTQVIVWVSGASSAIWPQQPEKQIKLTADTENFQPGQIAQVFIPNPFVDGAKAFISVERGEIMETHILDIDQAGYSFSLPISSEAVPNIYVSVILLGKTLDGNPDYRHGIINLPVAPIVKNLNVDLLLSETLTQPGKTVTATFKITDQQGNPVQGEFSIAVVDKAVLALMESNSQPILAAFYGEQPLAVQTSFSLKTFAVQSMLSDMALALGLGGGLGGGEDQLTIREEFPDTAFWQGQIVTGLDGTAQVEIPLPDSLTTWVVSVRGLSESYLVGEAETEIITQKSLMIQPQTPRFLVDGDVVEMAAVVFNNSTNVLSVDVSLQSVGFSLTDLTSQNQIVTLEPGHSEKVTWLGTVESVKNVDLVFSAVSGDVSDASAPLWGDLQVKRYQMPFTFSTAGHLQEAGECLELVSLPFSSDPSSGELTLALYPSLTATFIQRLEAMKSVSYEDTVSILSSLLANLSAYEALNNLGIESPQLEINLEDLVDQGISTLLNAQNFDGGWAWWSRSGTESASSDPFVTAYVLISLKQASQAGIRVDSYFIDRAEGYLINKLIQPGNISANWMLDRLAFQIYALRDSDLALSPYVDGLYARRSELAPWATAMLSLTIDDIDSGNNRVTTLINDLEDRAVRSSTAVYWESERRSWVLPGTPSFNTAMVISAFAQLDPASTSLMPALHYLMVYQSTDRRESSIFESAWVLMAVTEALQGTGDYQADFDFQARLNDQVIAEGTAGGTAPLTAVTASLSMDTLFPNSPNALLIERGEGVGTLYYRADFETYRPAATAAAVNKGVMVERMYYQAGEGCPGSDNCIPIDSIQLDPSDPTQRITVALTVIVPHDMHNFMLEDFIPAGTEIINQELITTQTFSETNTSGYDPRAPFETGWGWWYFEKAQIYDDRIIWVAEFLPAGSYTLTYELLPFQRGRYQVLPAHAWQYYYPEIQGTSSGELFTIE